MPIYEYVCKDCGYEFDTLRSMKDADAPIVCQKCEGNQTHRMLSVCFSQSEGHSVTPAAHQCSGSCGGSCASCGH
ncbi:MAG: zinc ribbon domain-containing protein [Anaerolineaceae bacterium]|nr:zinc ribbon domain-containing protein [Anaerolineaceae bacterium]